MIPAKHSEWTDHRGDLAGSTGWSYSEQREQADVSGCTTAEVQHEDAMLYSGISALTIRSCRQVTM